MTEENIMEQLKDMSKKDLIFNILSLIEGRLYDQKKGLSVINLIINDTLKSIENALKNVYDDELSSMVLICLEFRKNTNKLLNQIMIDIKQIGKIIDNVINSDNPQLSNSRVNLYNTHLDKYAIELEKINTELTKVRTKSRELINIINVNDMLKLDTVERRNKCIKWLKSEHKSETKFLSNLLDQLNIEIRDMIDIRKHMGVFPECSDLYNYFDLLLNTIVKVKEYSDKCNDIKNIHIKGVNRATNKKLLDAYAIASEFFQNSDNELDELIDKLNIARPDIDHIFDSIKKEKNNNEDDIEIDCDEDLLDV